MQRVAAIDAGVDLRPFLALLRQHGLAVHVSEESGRQVIWSADSHQAERIAALLEDWRAGRLDAPQAGGVAGAGGSSGAGLGRDVRNMANGLIRAAWQAPVSVTLIGLCLIVALVSRFGSALQPVRYLFFPEIDISAGNIAGLVAGMNNVPDVLRMLTPALLHFGVVHLVFNTLWLWYLGRQIEATVSPLRYLAVVVFAAFWGNVAQYVWTGGQTNFGGMSGVVYGLIGFIWIWQNLLPASRLRLPPAMIGIFLVALVLMEMLAGGWIATAAHVGGLVAGMLAGFLLASLRRMKTGTRG